MGHAAVAQVLLNSGAQAAAAVDAQGHILLMEAAGNGRADVVRLLLQHGADVHAVSAEHCTTALHHAADDGCCATAAERWC
jgi:ankyrin repeat protein